MGMKQKLSTSFHPETDGQTKRINTLVEPYLCWYCNYQQDNWMELLTMAEFSYNNTLSSSTGITPSYAMYGEHPRYLIRFRLEFTLPPPTILNEFAENLASLNEYLQNEMTWAQAVYSEQANKHRIPALGFEVGDEV